MDSILVATRKWLIGSPAIYNLVGDSIYADFLPLGQNNQPSGTLPAIVINLVSDVVWYDGTSGDTGAAQARLQFSIIEENLNRCYLVEQVLRQALSGYRGYFGTTKVMNTIRQNLLSNPLRDVQLSRLTTDYTIIYQNDFEGILC